MDTRSVYVHLWIGAHFAVARALACARDTVVGSDPHLYIELYFMYSIIRWRALLYSFLFYTYCPFWNGGSESRPEVVLILWESTRFTRRYMRLSIFLVGMSSEDQRGILSIVSEGDLWVFSTMTFSPLIILAILILFYLLCSYSPVCAMQA